MIRSFTRKAAFAACLSFLTAASAYAGSPTVLDVAKQKGNFNTLAKAIEVGGTTLRDYVGVDGNPGYFRQQLFVYERVGEPCRQCGTAVRQRVQGQRSTYWCPACQS